MHKISAVLGLVGLAKSVVAEDLLFAPNIGGTEKFSIIGGSTLDNGEPMLDMTAATPSEDEWRAMTTDDFKKFKAIIFGDKCRRPEDVKYIADTKDVWSAAITGNIALLGIEPLKSLGTHQFSYEVIQKNMINFVAGGSGTGLYYDVPCHDTEAIHTLDELSHFGSISVEYNPTNRVGGSLSNTAHLVASSELFITLNETQIAFDFDQDVANLFIDYPVAGPEGFEAAIITTKTGHNEGARSFADGSTGSPFVITRNAIPVGCSNGVFDGQFGEEQCDPLVAALSNATDVCNQSCKCLKNFPGVCPPPAVSSTSPSNPSTSSTAPYSSGTGTGVGTGSVVYPTSSLGSYPTSVVYPTTLYPSSTAPIKEVIGIEIIFIIEIVEYCPAGQTVTVTSTKTVSTVSREMHRTRREGYPCFPCLFGEPKAEYTTVFYDLCPTKSDYHPIVTAQLCHSCKFSTYTTTIPDYTPGPCNHCSTYVIEEKNLGIPTYTATYNALPYPTTTGRLVVTAAAPRATGVGVLGLLGGLAVAAAL